MAPQVGLALRATAGKQGFTLFSVPAFLVHFVNTKKIETGLLSCLYFLGSPSWTRTNDIVINSHALYRLSYWGIFNGFNQRMKVRAHSSLCHSAFLSLASMISSAFLALSLLSAAIGGNRDAFP